MIMSAIFSIFNALLKKKKFINFVGRLITRGEPHLYDCGSGDTVACKNIVMLP
jgi:hypothetical protein